MDLLAQHISTPVASRTCLFFRELDKGNKGPLGAYYNQGISNTSEILAKRTLVNYHSQRGTTICTTGGSNQAEGEGGSSPSAADRSSYRQPSLCGSIARRRLEADNRPEISQFMHGTAALQDGGTVYAPQHGEPGMAYGKIRPKRRILNHPYSPRISEAPYFSGWASTSTDAVPLSSIRALHRTIRLFKGYKANNSISTAVRNPSDSLSRRPTAGSSIQRAIVGESFDSNMASQQSGVSNKYPEVHHNSNLSPRVLRICSGYRSVDIISPNTQDQCHYERCNPPSSVRTVASERFGMSHWDINSNQASGMDWPLHYRALQDLKIQTLRQHVSYQTLISLSPEARADLQWWLSDLSHNCSAVIVKPEASIVIESDASMLGWGAVCQGVTTGGR